MEVSGPLFMAWFLHTAANLSLRCQITDVNTFGCRWCIIFYDAVPTDEVL